MALKNHVLAFLLLFCLSAPAYAEELQERTVLDGRVTLLTPRDFTPLPENLLKSKYPSERRPSEVLSNESGTVNLAFNYSPSEVPDDVEALREGLSEPFHKLYASAKWLKDEVIEINGRKFVLFEMTIPAFDADIHNIMYMTPLDGRLLLISFNVTEDEAPQWLEAGHKMMRSIRIK